MLRLLSARWHPFTLLFCLSIATQCMPIAVHTIPGKRSGDASNTRDLCRRLSPRSIKRFTPCRIMLVHTLARHVRHHCVRHSITCRPPPEHTPSPSTIMAPTHFFNASKSPHSILRAAPCPPPPPPITHKASYRGGTVKHSRKKTELLSMTTISVPEHSHAA